MTRILQSGLTVALALGLGGCAVLGRLPHREPAPAVEPVDRTPEFDFLVGMEHELHSETEEALAAYQRATAKDPESLYLKKKVAELLARLGRAEEAIQVAERALELAPDDTATRLFLGTLYRLQKDAEGAERVLRAEEGEPLGPEAAEVLYSLYLSAERYEDALAMARWLVRDDPDYIRGYVALATVYQQQKQYQEADDALNQALERHPDSLALYATLARLRRDREDLKGEEEALQRALAQFPDHRNTMVSLAQTQIELGDHDAARKTLERLLEQYPDDLRARRRLGLLELRDKHFDSAAGHFQKLLDLRPDARGIAYFLALARRGLGDVEGAIEALELVPPGHERYVDARVQLAGIYERRGEFDRALEEIRRAREHGSSRQLDLFEASLRTKAGDFEGAVAFLEELRAKAPEDHELLYALGVVYGESGRIDESLDIMQQVLEKSPDHAGALNYVGYTWAERGENLDQAEAMIQKALEIRPDDGFITDSLGWVYFMRARPLLEKGDYEAGRELLERAIRELEHALELTGGDPVIAEHLGDAYRLLENRRRALEMYEEALSLHPRPREQPDLEKKLESLRQELGAQ